MSIHRQNDITTDIEQWVINLRELRVKTGKSYACIAKEIDVSEKSVTRVFSGEAKNPGVDLIRRIIHALNGTWSEVFAESGAVIGGQDLATAQAEIARLTTENALLTSSLNIEKLDNSVLKDKVTALENEIKLLSLKLEYEEKIIAVHDFYNKR